MAATGRLDLAPATHDKTGGVLPALRRNLPPMAAFLFIVAAWEFVVRFFSVPLYLFPPPSRIAAYMAENWGLLVQHARPTLFGVLGGFLIGSLTGVTLAVFIAQSNLFRRTVFPLLVASQVIPKVALAPLVLLWLGHGTSPKVFLSALISFFPVVVNVAHGLSVVQPEIRDLTRSLRATRWQTLRQVQLYVALPYLLSSLKIAVTLSVIGTVVAEFVGASEGLGYLVTLGNFQLNTPLMFSSITMLVAIGILLFQVVSLVERLAIPWHHALHAET